MIKLAVAVDTWNQHHRFYCSIINHWTKGHQVFTIHCHWQSQRSFSRTNSSSFHRPRHWLLLKATKKLCSVMVKKVMLWWYNSTMDDDICAHMSAEMVKLIIGKEWHASLQLKMSKLLKEDENLIILYFCDVALIVGLIVNTLQLIFYLFVVSVVN